MKVGRKVVIEGPITEPFPMGAGEITSMIVEWAHDRLDEAFMLSSGMDQPPSPMVEAGEENEIAHNQWNQSAAVRLETILRDLVMGLTGREIRFL